MGRTITLLTDFGTADGYVGEMKGVLLSLAPAATIVDVSHDVQRHDTNGARLAVARYWRRFPKWTIHLVVVDPGVGSDRRALAVESDGYFLVGPDSGVLSPALLTPSARVVALGIPPGASNTFHGRDVFAPAAATLASGVPLDTLGTPIDAPILLRTPEPHRRPDGSVEGEIIHVDRFGNAVTNILAARDGFFIIDGRKVRVARTYASVSPGEPVALTGSTGLLEIAIREGNASDKIGLAKGARVLFQIDGDGA
jgi:S-adenosyl-L-methionine hydrolase (adenosine-forming)